MIYCVIEIIIMMGSASSGDLPQEGARQQGDIVYRALTTIGVKKLTQVMREAIAPMGAIVFPLRIPQGREYDQEEVDRVRGEFNVGDMILMHGIAFEANGKAVMLTGPPGIGKSTAIAKLGRRFNIKVMDDGFVLAGVDNEGGQPKVIQTGIHGSTTMRRVEGALRRMLVPNTPYLDLVGGQSDEAFTDRKVWYNFSTRLSRVVGTSVAAMMPPWKKMEFTPREVELADIIFLRHENDEHPPVILPREGGDMRIKLEDALGFLEGARSTGFRLPDPGVRDKVYMALEKATVRNGLHPVR
ncbi:MAG: hypothetical protein ABIH11_06065 [Candidatus Altiarchaeota archaeon]